MSGKGGDFERQICKYLSKWIQGTERPYVFWRGRGSGGVFTQDMTSGKDFAGDIYLVRDDGRFLTDMFSIECKNGYKTASMDKFLKYNKSDPIHSFWNQCVNDATLTKRRPLLIYRKKGIKPIWIGVDTDTYNMLKLYLDDKRFIHLSWDNDLPDTYFYGMDEFFECITPDVIKGFI